MKQKDRTELGALNLALAAGAVALLTVLSGCGGAYQNKAESSEQAIQRKAALELAPRIVPADPEDVSVPKFEDGKGDGGSGVVADRDRLVFSEVVAIPKVDGEEPPLFLVWDENALGIRISDAYFNLKKRDAYNRTYGGEERQNAYRDPKTGRWFVPLLTIIGGKPENADPSQIYWVRLELHLEDGKQVEISVGIRVRGPVPVIHPEPISLDTLSSIGPNSLGEKMDKEGLILAAEDYSNPAARPLALWIRGQATLGLKTALSTSRFKKHRKKIDVVEFRVHSQSQAELALKRLRVTRNFAGDGEPIEETLALDRWQKIILGPFERIRLEWIVELQEGTPVCALPPERVRGFKWRYEKCRKGPGRGSDSVICYEKTERATRLESWRVDGVTMTGLWSREIRVADPFLRDEEATRMISLEEGEGQESLIVLSNGKDMPVLETSGAQVHPDAQPFTCQGVF